MLHHSINCDKTFTKNTQNVQLKFTANSHIKKKTRYNIVVQS